jgi:hypothetical protein
MHGYRTVIVLAASDIADAICIQKGSDHESLTDTSNPKAILNITDYLSKTQFGSIEL